MSNHITLLLTLDDRLIGKWVFVAVFALLLLWLLWIPSRRLDGEQGPTRWWRSARLWAVLIAGVQMLVYALWG